MDSSTLLAYGLSAMLATLTFLYLLLVLLTPPIPRTPAAARTFISPLHPSAPKPLPSTVRDRATVDLSVIVPAYNETARLPAMLESALVHLTMLTSRSTPISSEVVIVDDGSKDDTAGKALELAGAHAKEAGSKAIEVRVVRLPRNVGKGGAVRHGMLHARGRRLLMVDADGASRFEDVDALWAAMDTIAPLEGDGAGVVVGSRAHLVSTAAVVKRSPLRNVLMYGLHTILRVVGVGHVADTQCGFKLFSRSAAATIFARQRLTTWIFDVELLLLAQQAKVPVREVPVNWHEVPGSKLNVVWDSLQMLRDLLVMRGNMMVGRWEVKEEEAERVAKAEVKAR